MLWTLQLSPWALPPLLALLLLMRELLFVWPRRREASSRALLLLAVTSGAWVLLQLLAVISPSLGVKAGLERAQYAAMAFVPVAWVMFAMVYAQRTVHLRRWPAGILYAVSGVTAALAVGPDTFRYILRDMSLATHPSGLTELVVEYGPWFWLHTGIRFVAVIAAAGALAWWMVRERGARKRAPFVVVAALLLLAPTALHLASDTGAQWIDLSPTGAAFAATALGWGLLRHRFLDLGPVARTLVMVELRDPIVVMDGKGRIVDVNRAAENTLGLHPYDDVPLQLGTFWAASRGKSLRSARLVLDIPGVPEHEGHRVFDVTITPLGRVEGSGRTALLLRDVTVRERSERQLQEATAQLQKANEELERRANTDGLTGLANRRHFMEELARELERTSRYGRPLSILMLDLDHFKDVNDSHGHAAGDDVLRATADALRAVSRDIDLPARLGGEEMAVLLPETDAAGALHVAERLRERIGSQQHEAPKGTPFRVTASIGVASVGQSTRTVEALLQQADEALYTAKDEGRNRVVVAA